MRKDIEKNKNHFVFIYNETDQKVCSLFDKMEPIDAFEGTYSKLSFAEVTEGKINDIIASHSDNKKFHFIVLLGESKYITKEQIDNLSNINHKLISSERALTFDCNVFCFFPHDSIDKDDYCETKFDPKAFNIWYFVKNNNYFDLFCTMLMLFWYYEPTEYNIENHCGYTYANVSLKNEDLSVILDGIIRKQIADITLEEKYNRKSFKEQVEQMRVPIVKKVSSKLTDIEELPKYNYPEIFQKQTLKECLTKVYGMNSGHCIPEIILCEQAEFGKKKSEELLKDNIIGLMENIPIESFKKADFIYNELKKFFDDQENDENKKYTAREDLPEKNYSISNFNKYKKEWTNSLKLKIKNSVLVSLADQFKPLSNSEVIRTAMDRYNEYSQYNTDYGNNIERKSKDKLLEKKWFQKKLSDIQITKEMKVEFDEEDETIICQNIIKNYSRDANFATMDRPNQAYTSCNIFILSSSNISDIKGINTTSNFRRREVNCLTKNGEMRVLIIKKPGQLK